MSGNIIFANSSCKLETVLSELPQGKRKVFCFYFPNMCIGTWQLLLNLLKLLFIQFLKPASLFLSSSCT